ncbi:MAG: hypothetical protein IKR85_08290 [Clostridia bacterium]|nr:hypothetical protein [Clostridia bacterium]
MTNRERMLAVLHYENYDRMPCVDFGFWRETLDKWVREGHLEAELAANYSDNNDADFVIMQKLGFDFNWGGGVSCSNFLSPAFEPETLEVRPDGSVVRRDSLGLIVRTKPGVISIPAHEGSTLTGREAWEEFYLPKLTMRADRVNYEAIKRAYDNQAAHDTPVYIFFGSLYGNVRSMVGLEELSYLAIDDEELYEEVVATVDKLCFDCAEAMLRLGFRFDYGHFWEDICFKTGPLLRPSLFSRLCGPWYKKITSLAAKYGIDIVSVDCDGKIDELVPVWLENGVNTMFPIEVGTWNASIEPWRQKYGRAIRGVGGMDKRVFAQDFSAVDKEIERLKRLIDLGGYIPCPDHRIPPDAEWDNVRYYCDRFRHEFG